MKGLAFCPPELLSQVVELDQHEMDYPWRPIDWVGLSSDKRVILWVDGQRVVGFALYALQDELAHLLKLVVIPELRGSDDVSRFWSFQIFELKMVAVRRIYLEVSRLNLRAQRFYEKNGFQKLHEIRSFYRDGADALILELLLD